MKKHICLLLLPLLFPSVMTLFDEAFRKFDATFYNQTEPTFLVCLPNSHTHYVTFKNDMLKNLIHTYKYFSVYNVRR